VPTLQTAAQDAVFVAPVLRCCPHPTFAAPGAPQTAVGANVVVTSSSLTASGVPPPRLAVDDMATLTARRRREQVDAEWRRRGKKREAQRLAQENGSPEQRNAMQMAAIEKQLAPGHEVMSMDRAGRSGWVQGTNY
jgi:hypothetical protein